jgi:hypothetical protein
MIVKSLIEKPIWRILFGALSFPRRIIKSSNIKRDPFEVLIPVTSFCSPAFSFLTFCFGFVARSCSLWTRIPRVFQFGPKNILSTSVFFSIDWEVSSVHLLIIVISPIRSNYTVFCRRTGQYIFAPEE